ncbi:Glu/Leu/Phe/Val family dehydrogenase [Ktedonospora formicarum]
MTNSILDIMQTYDHENVILCQEKGLGVRAIIAIHDTTLGPAAGGMRMLPYASEQDAIDDALRLARGMTYKAAVAGVNHGGGKCIVIGDPRHDKNEALFCLLGRFIERLGGHYITGEDVGTNAFDMDIIGRETRYVFALPSGEEVSDFTAIGVMQGIRASLQQVYGSADLQGCSVAVQGIGSVGGKLVKRLIEAGAVVSIADIDQAAVEQVARDFPEVSVLPPQEVHTHPVDVYCPCALGAILSSRTIPELQCKIVCGAANNQLADEQCSDLLMQQGIVYAPDFVVNAGGLIAYADSYTPEGFQRQRALTNVERIYHTLESIFALSGQQSIATAHAADLIAEQRIAAMRQAKSAMAGLSHIR